MNVLGLDTATPATVAGVLRRDGEMFEARHDPAPDERPGHATHLLGLLDRALGAAGLGLAELDRVAVGVGPGSFTGLRIGVATARGLAQGAGIELAPVSTLRALAAAAPASPVAAVLDARRGEVFAAAWEGGRELLAPAALTPEALAQTLSRLRPAPLALGDGALRFRGTLQAAGADVPPEADPLHRLAARRICELGAQAVAAGRDAVLPHYLRRPDAEAWRERRTP
jgi:tRNA threonylcarbamoyladenosine biosynthesis protein TsaB